MQQPKLQQQQPQQQQHQTTHQPARTDQSIRIRNKIHHDLSIYLSTVFTHKAHFI